MIAQGSKNHALNQSIGIPQEVPKERTDRAEDCEHIVDAKEAFDVARQNLLDKWAERD